MLAVWLRRSEEQIYPTWRGLCLAIAGVDRIAAQRIARENPCDCSYCTGRCKLFKCMCDLPAYVIRPTREEFENR